MLHSFDSLTIAAYKYIMVKQAVVTLSNYAELKDRRLGDAKI